MEYSSCAFSGHRVIWRSHSETLPGRLSEVIDMLIESGVTEFKNGGARGFDLLAAELVLEKKRQGADIRLTMLLPCRDQADKWGREARRRYEEVLNAADQVIYVSEKYDSFCMHLRNRALVEDSDILLCYLVNTSSGTAYTKNYAEEKGLKIVNIADLL